MKHKYQSGFLYPSFAVSQSFLFFYLLPIFPDTCHQAPNRTIGSINRALKPREMDRLQRVVRLNEQIRKIWRKT